MYLEKQTVGNNSMEQVVNDHIVLDQNAANVIKAESSKKSAKTFYYGNIIAVLIPFPFFIFWFGASMFVYAMYRHHPNNRVGYHTQRAAYYYYALSGLLVPILTFAPGDFFYQYWWLLWGIFAMALIPTSLYEISKINKETWKNIRYETK